MPNILVKVDTSDFLMYQSNVLTFDSASVSIELTELRVKEAQGPPPKVVTFKSTSSFNMK